MTNRHVADRHTDIYVRFNRPLSSGSDTYSLPLEGDDLTMPWTVHPKPNADVAVRMLNFPKLKTAGAELAYLSNTHHTLSLDQARQSGMSEGDGVFILGFPLGMAGKERNYVIARQGIVARIQGWLDGNEEEFLIDASIFPGNSGGPVFTVPHNVAIQGTQHNDRCSLIGMVSSYVPYEEVAVSKQTGRVRMLFEENSGLGVVVPFDLIEETIVLALHNATTVQQALPLPPG